MKPRGVTTIDDRIRTRYRRDGVVHLPSVIPESTQHLARELYEWSRAHPGPGASKLPGKGSGIFYQDLANPRALGRYLPLVRDPALAGLVAALWDSPHVWFMYEQVFAKTGGETRRTPWHQDTPYLPVRGNHVAVVWMSFEPVALEQALEFVRGSHRRTLYDGSRFDPEDDTAPLYGDGTLPRLPDIEAQRERWPIVSWATEPGDAIVFHPALLHGGGATTARGSRHTLSLRFFGEDAVVAARPGRQVGGGPRGVDPDVHPLTRMRQLPDGAPFRDPAFPGVYGQT